ncbi:PREDICTED: facilitated trehalose transporter Tret1-like [Vollenhovia emeryi]|uniref:facilitated trehalose transporter Tret1-like n=1 Tax=Vollenhovia emeryi TaxID=411798 RepID=UPI0005F4D05E|nr:PREDICTED: facilitated trehalose transporter Tret1-like [Vollenhovia emeryi]
MEKHEKPPEEPGKLRQFLAAIVVNQLGVSYGLVMGWQSPSTPLLQGPSPPVGHEPMTDDAVSWLTGTLCLSGTIMTVLLSVIPDRFSRKRFGYAIMLPIIISWLLVTFATEHTYLYISRILCGVSGASTFFLVPNYVSEIACDSIRGMLASIVVFSVNSGILLAYILGGVMSFRAFPMAVIALAILYFVTFIFMPESPFYLVRRNRVREAIRSLKWLKAGNSLVAERTLSHIQLQVKETTSTKSAKFSDLLRDRATIKGLIIVLGLYVGQQLCGIFAMISNTETIFKMSGSSLTPNVSSIIVAIMQLFGSWLAVLLVERAGRRPLLLLSCVGMCVCHCVIGTFCYLQSLQYEVSPYSWIPVVALSSFMIIYALGMGIGPVVIMSEIFSRDVTSLASTVSLSVSWASAFVVTKSFSDLVALLDTHGCFFLLAFFCACSFLFTFVLLPETKGRLREDIVDELNGVRCTKTNNIKHIIGSDSVHAAYV